MFPMNCTYCCTPRSQFRDTISERSDSDDQHFTSHIRQRRAISLEPFRWCVVRHENSAANQRNGFM